MLPVHSRRPTAEARETAVAILLRQYLLCPVRRARIPTVHGKRLWCCDLLHSLCLSTVSVSIFKKKKSKEPLRGPRGSTINKALDSSTGGPESNCWHCSHQSHALVLSLAHKSGGKKRLPHAKDEHIQSKHFNDFFKKEKRTMTTGKGLWGRKCKTHFQVPRLEPPPWAEPHTSETDLEGQLTILAMCTPQSAPT